MGFLDDHRTFWREFRGNFHTTGAVMPSGRSLARKLARYVANEGADAERRILEVGPGTGAVTQAIIRSLGSNSTLDLVELNDQFVESLRRRFEFDEGWKAVAARATILHKSVQDLPDESRYDAIVSGLPLNNFDVASVESILSKLRQLTAPGGTLSFFQYIAVRRAKVALSGREQRQRLRGVGRAMDELLGPHEFRREAVLANVPPAWVHHLRFDD